MGNSNSSSSKALHSYLNGHIVEILPQRELLTSPLMVVPPSSSSAKIPEKNPFLLQQRRKITYDATKQQLRYELAIDSSATTNTIANNANQLFKVFANKSKNETENVESLTFIPLCLILEKRQEEEEEEEEIQQQQQENGGRNKRRSSVISIPQDYLLNRVALVPDQDFIVKPGDKFEKDGEKSKIVSFKLWHHPQQRHAGGDSHTLSSAPTTAHDDSTSPDPIAICVDQKTNTIVTLSQSQIKELDESEKKKPGASLILQHFAIRIVSYPLLVHPPAPTESALFGHHQSVPSQMSSEIITTTTASSPKQQKRPSIDDGNDVDVDVDDDEESSTTFIPAPTSTKHLTLSTPPFELANFSRPDFRVDQQGANSNLGVTSLKMRVVQPLSASSLNSVLREFKIFVKSPPGSHSRQTSFRRHVINNRAVGVESAENTQKQSLSLSSSSPPTSPKLAEISSRKITSELLQEHEQHQQQSQQHQFPIISIHTSQSVVFSPSSLVPHTSDASAFVRPTESGLQALSSPTEDEMISSMRALINNNAARQQKIVTAESELSSLLEFLLKKFSCPVVLNPVQLGNVLQNFRLEPCLCSTVDNDNSNNNNNDKMKSRSQQGECLSDYEGYFYLVLQHQIGHHHLAMKSSTASSSHHHQSSDSSTLSIAEEAQLIEKITREVNKMGLVLDLDIDKVENDDPNARLLRDAEKLYDANDRSLASSSPIDIDSVLMPIPLCLRPKSIERKKTQLWSFVSRIPLAQLNK